MRPSHRNTSRLTAVTLVAVVVGMVGLSFASVPLYRLFCQVTGYAGTPKTQGVTESNSVVERTMTVRFDANVNSALPWQFKPVQHQVKVKLGEQRLIHYEAVNHADHAVTGTATFSVTPYKAAQYFTKIQCFCFTEQRLEPGQRVSMPVLFYIDPAIDDDPNAQDVTMITLSYTFYPAEVDDEPTAATDDDSAARAGAG